MNLILFDIDGTLVSSGGAGTRSLNLAFKEVFSIEHAFSGISMAGKTDIQIMKEALGKYRLTPDDGVIPALTTSYLSHLSIEINNDRKYIMPGIIDVLDRLSESSACSLGLLTGNLEEGARIKLNAFNLTRYFPGPIRGQNPTPLFGAFGSDNEDRKKLLPVAVRKFNDISGKTVGYRDCIVVGDTPLDVQCAKPYGALTVAIATGPYSVEHLKTAGADITMKSLSEPEALIDLANGELNTSNY